jgi:hypothetical protein
MTKLYDVQELIKEATGQKKAYRNTAQQLLTDYGIPYLEGPGPDGHFFVVEAHKDTVIEAAKLPKKSAAAPSKDARIEALESRVAELIIKTAELEVIVRGLDDDWTGFIRKNAKNAESARTEQMVDEVLRTPAAPKHDPNPPETQSEDKPRILVVGGDSRVTRFLEENLSSEIKFKHANSGTRCGAAGDDRYVRLRPEADQAGCRVDLATERREGPRLGRRRARKVRGG